MNERNPYRAPAAEVVATEAFPGRWRLAVLVLVALQLLGALINLPPALDLVRHGDVAPLALLLAASATVLLTCGGIALMLSRPRIAACLFGASAPMGGVVLLQWSSLIVVTGSVIALVACTMSIHASRFPARR